MKRSIQNTIKEYIEGNLPEAETIDLEWQMEQDPFLADAVEGYITKPALLNKFQEKSLHQHLSKWIAYSALLVVFIFAPRTSSDFQSQLDSIPARLNFASHAETVNSAIKPMALADLPELELRPVKPELKSQLSALRAPVEIFSSRIEMVHIPALGVEIFESNDLKAVRDLKYHYKTQYLYNLKVIVVDTTLDQSARFQHDHVPAAFESKSNLDRSLNIYTPRVLSKHYMDEPLDHFAKGNYEECLRSLNEVSRRLPNNVNVSFYRALCLYELYDYEAALKHFRKTQRHIEQGFAEESTWYQALCLDALGKDKEAEKLYQKILDRNGFYALRAASKMALNLQSK